MGDGARRSLLTLGAGLVLLATPAAGSVPAALAAPGARLDPSLVPAAAVSDQVGLPVLGGSRSGSQVVTVADLSRSAQAPAVGPLYGLLQADLLVVAPTTLRRGIAAAVRRMEGAVAPPQVHAARVQVNGKFPPIPPPNPPPFPPFPP